MYIYIKRERERERKKKQMRRNNHLKMFDKSKSSQILTSRAI